MPLTSRQTHHNGHAPPTPGATLGAAVEALAAMRWAEHLARLTLGEERAARRVIKDATRDIERSRHHAFERGERDAIEAVLVARLITHLATAVESAKRDADALFGRMPDVVAAPAEQKGQADGR